MSTKFEDLSEIYEENGFFFVDEALYPESRGFDCHMFDTREQAENFRNSFKPSGRKIEYSKMVSSLAKDGEDILRDLTPEKAHAWHMASCVCGEAGELFDAVKKAAIYNKPLDRENVVEELGDIEFYLEGLRQAYDITREETIEHNTNKLGKRYKGGTYSNDAAQARADKEG